MRICLVSPSAHLVYRNIKRSSKRQPMLGPAYIAAALASRGHQVSHIDADALDLTGKEACDAILGEYPDLIGFSFTTPMFSETADLISTLRRNGWKGHITLGGVHATALPHETLEILKGADSLVRGEGEEAAPALADCLEKGLPLSQVPSLVYRDRENIIHSGQYQTIGQIGDLDSYPLPAIDLYPLSKYKSDIWGTDELQMGVLITTRGCPYSCEFCASGRESWGKLRYHGLDRVMAEVDRLKRLGARYLVFNDDTFTVKPSRCLEIASRLKTDGLEMPFMITARTDTVNDRLLGALADAGCFMATYGIESGSDRILENIGKNTTTDMARMAIAATKKHGIRTVGNFMFGHYPDNVATCQATLDFALELACDLSQFSIAIPYPGTQLYERAHKEGRLIIDPFYANFGYYGNVPWRHPQLSAGELIEFQQKAYAAFRQR